MDVRPIPDLHLQRVEIKNRVERIQRTVLLDFNFFDDRISHGRD